MMNSPNIVQAYRTSPRRRQIQIFGGVLGTLIIMTTGLLLYIDVSARASSYGREVLYLQENNLNLRQRIENKENELAILTSVDVMRQRAEDLGYVYVNPGTSTFMEVEGYQPAQTGVFTLEGDSQHSLDQTSTTLLPVYTETLLNWVQRVILRTDLTYGDR